MVNPALWTCVDQDQTYSSGSVALDGSGHLRVDVSSSSNGPVAKEYAASLGTQTDEPWTCYTAARFTASAPGWSTIDLGYRFEMSDNTVSNPSYAFLEFDSRDGMKLKYGDPANTYDGPALYASQWYELKFAWDGTDLRG